jgi:hypothetical protein
MVVMDNIVDAHLRDVPGWFGDRHQTLAGYHVIGDEAARFLAPLIRQRAKADGASRPGRGRKEASPYRSLLGDGHDLPAETGPVGHAVDPALGRDLGRMRRLLKPRGRVASDVLIISYCIGTVQYIL